ncbi:hypothetical protein [Scytonema sp. NUACC26]|uniref:hypothetical protein n=1 Tax=Scytonema sp. NUACC26 TaxID=3140176 RepID=UPI0038B2C5F7
MGTQRQEQRVSSSTNSVQNSTSSQISTPIVEAQGWVFNDKGEIVLVANNSTVSTLQPSSRNLDGCSAR